MRSKAALTRVWTAGLLAVGVLVVVASTAGANSGDPVTIGQYNSSGGNPTYVDVNPNADWQVPERPTQGFVANQVYAIKRTDLIQFQEGAAIEAYGNDGAINAVGLDYGVRTLALADGGVGVWSVGADTGIKVTGAGTGLDVQGSTAINAKGSVQFSTAGLAVVAKGRTSVTVSPGVPIDGNTKVLATLQSGGGTLKRVGRDLAGGNAFTIWLTASATQNVTVAYFVIS